MGFLTFLRTFAALGVHTVDQSTQFLLADGKRSTERERERREGLRAEGCAYRDGLRKETIGKYAYIKVRKKDRCHLDIMYLSPGNLSLSDIYLPTIRSNSSAKSKVCRPFRNTCSTCNWHLRLNASKRKRKNIIPQSSIISKFQPCERLLGRMLHTTSR